MPSLVSEPDAARRVQVRHWRAVVRLTLSLLVLWAALGLGCGVLFADVLNQYQIGGFPLGFWFAQQGAIVGFVLLILVYALAMARLEARQRRELQQAERDQGTAR